MEEQLNQKEINKIKESAEEFFKKMTLDVYDLKIDFLSEENNSSEDSDKITVNVNVKSAEPQILIGQQGQTLFEIQRLLKAMLNKKLQKIFYLNLDINDYKKKKVEYLKDLAKESADRVFLTKEEKALSPMSSYERRIIHSELAKRTDVATESRGDGFDRHIVIKPV